MRYRVLLLLWILSDFALFIASYALSYFFRVGWILSTDFPFDQFIAVTAAIAPLWLLVLSTTRTFHLTRNQATVRNALYIAYASVVGVALFTLGYYFTYTIFFSRLLLGYAFIIHAVTTWLWHITFDHMKRRVLRMRPPAFPVLIIGVTRESRALISRLNRRRSPLTPVAILDSTGVRDPEIDGVPVLGKLNKLEEVLGRFGITHLIQCSDLEQSLNLLSACRQRGLSYVLLPSVLGIVERDERVESLEGYPVTVVDPRGGVWSWFFR